MAENRREKDKRYYFTRGQMALLGGAFTLASVIIFGLGMFVGKEIEARKIVRPEEPLVKVPVKPAPRGAAGTEGAKSKDDLTFYNTLTKTPESKQAAETKTEEKEPRKPPGPRRKRKSRRALRKRRRVPKPRRTAAKNLRRPPNPKPRRRRRRAPKRKRTARAGACKRTPTPMRNPPMTWLIV